MPLLLSSSFWQICVIPSLLLQLKIISFLTPLTTLISTHSWLTDSGYEYLTWYLTVIFCTQISCERTEEGHQDLLAQYPSIPSGMDKIPKQYALLTKDDFSLPSWTSLYLHNWVNKYFTAKIPSQNNCPLYSWTEQWPENSNAALHNIWPLLQCSEDISNYIFSFSNPSKMYFLRRNTCQAVHRERILSYNKLFSHILSH